MAAKKPVVDPNQALIDKYTAAGLSDVKNTYVKKSGNKQVFDTAAADKAVFEIPKITQSKDSPSSFTKSVLNYSDVLSQAQKVGITNLNTKDQQALRDAAKIVRDFDSKNLSGDAKQIITNITGGTDLIDQINNKKQDIQAKQNLIQGLSPDGSKLPKGSKVDKAAETKSLSILQTELQS